MFIKQIRHVRSCCESLAQRKMKPQRNVTYYIVFDTVDFGQQQRARRYGILEEGHQLVEVR
jgi:hypothetical protein